MNPDKDEITVIQEDFQLKFEISKWEQKINETTHKPELIFEIDVSSEVSKKNWAVYHSLEDFKNLLYNISSICLHIPEFSGFQQLEKNNNAISIGEALSKFSEYLKNISYRSDIMNSRYFIEFFNLENHFANLEKFEPRVLCHVTNLQYQVIDIIFLQNTKTLIVACAENEESSLKFWSKKEKKSELLIYKLNLNSNDNFKDENKENNNVVISTMNNVKIITEPICSLVNKINIDNNIISCLYLSENSKYLFVGYVDASFEVYETSDDVQKVSAQVISSIIKIQLTNSKNKIINFGFNPLTNYIYSVCYNSNTININFIDSKNLISSIYTGKDYLVGFNYLSKHQLLSDIVIFLDNKGKLTIGNIDNKNLNIFFVSITQLPQASLFKVNWEYNHIYIGDKEGEIDVINFNLIDNKNKETQLKRIFTGMMGKQITTGKKIAKMFFGNYPYEIKDVAFNANKNELFIALHNGTIQIFSHFKDFPECVLFENVKCLNRILFNKNESFLFTGGEEKDVFVYYIPQYYCTELSRKLQDANLYKFMNENKVIKNSMEKENNNNEENLNK